ncbi:MAG: death-on-curing protein [Candidatus Poriferisodalaceae bacterium]
MTTYLTVEIVIEITEKAIGEKPLVRDLGLLGSAVARPQATAYGSDAYPTILTKAAALLQSLASNHRLVDGNKRMAWISTFAFLELNGFDAGLIDNEAAFEITMSVATGEAVGVDDIAALLRDALS